MLNYPLNLLPRLVYNFQNVTILKWYNFRDEHSFKKLLLENKFNHNKFASLFNQ